MVFYGRFTPSYTQIGYRTRALFWRDPKPDFAGQTWVVTGASGGLGRFMALEAARLGAKVIAVAESVQAGPAACRRPGHGGRPH